MTALLDDNANRSTLLSQSADMAGLNVGATVSGYSGADSIEELTKEVEMLKQKLEEERAKFNDVECKPINRLYLTENRLLLR
jgi:predicted TIM-barrel enzyme